MKSPAKKHSRTHEPRITRHITLTRKDIEFLKTYGNGFVSTGISNLIKIVDDLKTNLMKYRK